AHHVHLTDLDIGFFDSNCRVDPPFRSQRDRDALRAGLADGTIDAICSDHTPVDEDAQQLPFGEAEAGVTGLELLLPLTLKWAAEAGLSLKRALARVTTAPARLLGEPAIGLAVGAAADLCVFNPDEHWVVSRGSLLSQGSHTPYLGRELAGRVQRTLVDGRVVFERG
ncbi:MAG: amidohydrolase family protein, partial [Betaproteobacteria bacterium]